MKRVQSLQNTAVRLITGARRRDHITPVLFQLHWLPVGRRVEFKLACLVRQALCGQMLRTWLMISISSPKATDDPFGLPLITCVRCHVRTTASKTEDLALPVREFGTFCHVACKHLTSATNILQDSIAIAKKTARCAQYMGALKSFESPHYAPGYCSRNF